MTFENLPPTSTPTGRISKAKKGKRVHACEYPGCGKVSEYCVKAVPAVFDDYAGLHKSRAQAAT